MAWKVFLPVISIIAFRFEVSNLEPLLSSRETEDSPLSRAFELALYIFLLLAMSSLTRLSSDNARQRNT